MRSFIQAALVATLLVPATARAQSRPLLTDTTATEPDQELDNFSGGFNKIHRITGKLRGVRAANKIVYWVSADHRHLSAFQAGKLLWTTDVVSPFKEEIPTAHISTVILASNILFVSLGERGMAEVDRKTGQVVARYFDRDPNHLMAEPK